MDDGSQTLGNEVGYSPSTLNGAMPSNRIKQVSSVECDVSALLLEAPSPTNAYNQPQIMGTL